MKKTISSVHILCFDPEFCFPETLILCVDDITHIKLGNSI